uniref:Uncharacterized protein n=1 Tax=Oryza punctata TaxID=4537 RepID=A0A0E0K8M6_ORYPU
MDQLHCDQAIWREVGRWLEKDFEGATVEERFSISTTEGRIVWERCSISTMDGVWLSTLEGKFFPLSTTYWADTLFLTSAHRKPEQSQSNISRKINRRLNLTFLPRLPELESRRTDTDDDFSFSSGTARAGAAGAAGGGGGGASAFAGASSTALCRAGKRMQSLVASACLARSQAGAIAHDPSKATPLAHPILAAAVAARRKNQTGSEWQDLWMNRSPHRGASFAATADACSVAERLLSLGNGITRKDDS